MKKWPFRFLVVCLVILIAYSLATLIAFIATPQFIEPDQLGVLFEEIKNSSDAEVIIINPFTHEYFKIAPQETKRINTWLPNANVIKKLALLKVITERGTIWHPDNRFLIVLTKNGLSNVMVGKSYSFLTG